MNISFSIFCIIVSRPIYYYMFGHLGTSRKKKHVANDNKHFESWITCVCVCVRFTGLSPFRWGGPRPICWFMPKGSWGLGFMALVWRAESELVLCGEGVRGCVGGEVVNAEWSAPRREEDSSSGGWVTSWSASTADLTSSLRPRLKSQGSADLLAAWACPHMHGYSWASAPPPWRTGGGSSSCVTPRLHRASLLMSRCSQSDAF